MTRKKVLLVSNDHVGRRMVGPAIRYYEFARGLAERFDVTLVIPLETDLEPQPFDVVVVARDDGTRLTSMCGDADVVVAERLPVPTMAALARARRHLDLAGARDVTLVATGGFRRAQDMVKALALGADAIAVSNVALQAIGCVGMRACHTDNCPMGIATQKPHLRARLPVQRAAEQLTRYLGAITELMVVLARACGHDSLSHFTPRDLTSWKRDVADLVGVSYAGVAR